MAVTPSIYLQMESRATDEANIIVEAALRRLALRSYNRSQRVTTG
ncbi:MAG: hypothetical protein ACC652_11135 [Acidimicrobiales bacterium]